MMTTTLENDRDQVLHFVSMMGLGEAPTFGLCLVLVEDAIDCTRRGQKHGVQLRVSDHLNCISSITIVVRNVPYVCPLVFSLSSDIG